jgi:uncharacterized repeat protein (TIGR01451 family)
MKRTYSRTFIVGLGGIALAVAAWCGLALAQQRGDANARANRAAQDKDALVLIFPTGDANTSALRVDVMSPAEVPVGQDYNYKIRVTNLTRNLVLEDVKVNQTDAEGFSVEDVKVAGQGGNQDQGNQGQGNQGQGNKNQGNKGNPQASQNGSNGGSQWSIDKLQPGESKEITVTALGDKEGTSKVCISVDYKPTLCVATKFTKPEIQVTKEAPEKADICHPVEIRYTVKNTGSGVARKVVVTDDLPEGLTSDENSKVKREVGDLQPGQTRDFTVTVQPAKTGEFGSRAEANAEGDLHARSNEETTRIVQAQLTADITGPSAQYVGEPMTYQAHVKNEGDATAPDARLRIDVDDACRIVRMSKSEPQGVTPQESGKTLSWNFGDLEPGAERTVSFTVVSRQEAELKHIAHATAACAVGGDLAKAATDTKQVTTAMLTFPALLLEMVDEVDPVKVGDEERYAIVVRNQGSGPDNNVRIKLQIPDQFEFVGASGSSRAEADGNTINFEPIDTLGPKAKAGWTVRLKAKKPGDVRTKVELNSEYLDSAVPELEPTRVIE